MRAAPWKRKMSGGHIRDPGMIATKQLRPRYRPLNGEASLWCFIHQLDIEREKCLLLAGILLTPFPFNEAGLTAYQLRVIGRMQSSLATYRRLGALPEGDCMWVWPDGKKGPAPVQNQTEQWIEAKLASSFCVALRVPQSFQP
jgi:hypothetical protein